MPSSAIRRAPAGEDRAGHCHAGSARRLDRKAAPGSVHGFTGSKSGRDSLHRDHRTGSPDPSHVERATIVHPKRPLKVGSVPCRLLSQRAVSRLMTLRHGCRSETEKAAVHAGCGEASAWLTKRAKAASEVAALQSQQIGNNGRSLAPGERRDARVARSPGTSSSSGFPSA